MYISDFAFIPHGDMCADDKEIVSQHHKKIRENKYTEATKFLDDNNYQDGFRASLFNKIEDKFNKFQFFILNKYVAKPDEFYSPTPPTAEQMKDKKFWIQPYN